MGWAVSRWWIGLAVVAVTLAPAFRCAAQEARTQDAPPPAAAPTLRYPSAEPAAERVLAGPMQAWAGITDAALWVQTRRPERLQLRYWPSGSTTTSLLSEVIETTPEGDHIALFRLADLPFGTRFDYELYVDGERAKFDWPLAFRTQPHWRWRTPPPDVAFAFGSCAYINEPPYDRPGKPYGGGYEIFDAIAASAPDFMLWLGDNIYYREPDWLSEAAMRRRWRHSRSTPELQRLLAAAPQYATWDDHDFGPNDSDRSFALRAEALRIFADYFPAPQRGTAEAPGVYQRFEWSDAEFFLLDDRMHRDASDATTQTAGRTMLGRAQLEWLMQGLASSNATFKFICNGSQVLIPPGMAHKEALADYPAEQQELLDFLVREQVKGVVFLSGDRHISELLRRPLDGLGYELHEFTSSPLTAGVSNSPENNDSPLRVDGTFVHQRSFGRIEISGPVGERRLRLLACDSAGRTLWTHEITQTELGVAARRP